MCGEKVFANVSAGADTKANTMGAAAHPRLVMLVSLRTAASAEAPSAPIRLLPRLQQRGGARRSEIRHVSGPWKKSKHYGLGSSTERSRFEYGAAYDSDCSVELPLRPSASAAPPFGPISL